MLLDKNFEVEFAKVYPNFTKKLILLNEQLTFTEVKICMYIKMNFSNKQILDLMHISESTLSNLRSNIRKKLNLDRKKGLFTTIIKL